MNAEPKAWLAWFVLTICAFRLSVTAALSGTGVVGVVGVVVVGVVVIGPGPLGGGDCVVVPVGGFGPKQMIVCGNGLGLGAGVVVVGVVVPVPVPVPVVVGVVVEV